MCVVSVFGGQHSCLYCCCWYFNFHACCTFCLLTEYICSTFFFFNMDTFVASGAIACIGILLCVGVGGGGGAGLCVGFY